MVDRALSKFVVTTTAGWLILIGVQLSCGLLLGCRLLAPRGAVAQLGERRVRNAKVGSSILLGSTN